MRKDTPLAVEVPSPERDKPGWVKVGVIAAVGFVLGIAWPRVMGVRLGPSAPGESAAAAASASATARAAEAPPASVTASVAAAQAVAPVAPAPVAAKEASAAPVVRVPRGAVIACRTKDGDNKKGKDCGKLGALDPVVQPALRKLSSCAATRGQTGKLSVVVTAEFPSGKLRYDIGKSSTVGNADGIDACLKKELQGATASGIAHDHPRYTVAYGVQLGAGDSSRDRPQADNDEPAERSDRGAKTSDPEPKAPALAAGEAAVEWEVALVRDLPKTGQVVARLPRGTKVKVGSAKEGWYSVKYGAAFANEGWLYRGAIGR